MARDRDNAKTNFDITAPGYEGAETTTVFNQCTYDNSIDSHMNFSQISRETKSDGESVLEGLPVPI